MGNPRRQGDRALAGYRTNDSLAIINISRLLRLQTGGQGAIARWASAANAELHQLACVLPGDALSIQGEPVHQLARSWLQYRFKKQVYSERQNPNSERVKLSPQGFSECA